MKNICKITAAIVIVITMASDIFAQGGVAVNTSGAAADSSAILDASSTTQGALVPRMTDVQRDAIVNPAEGLLIFNTDTKCFNFFRTGAWWELCGDSLGAPPSPPSTADTFDFTGAQQSFIVPAGVTQVAIECYGAQGIQGEQGNYDGGPTNLGTLGGVGGLGGKATGTLAVTPGQTLYIFVGGQNSWNGGGSPGTGNGCAGGNGGGASDVRVGGTGLGDRVIVAGGGGGGGGGAEDKLCSPGTPTAGGDGSGGGSGIDGGTGSCPGGPGPGVGGYYSGTGGAGGTGSYSGTAGTNGTSGQGGNGGSTFPAPPYSTGLTGTGGGGGGGYTGGGAGGGAGFNGGCGAPGGGGAGGTSYTGGVTSPTTQPSVRTGDGRVIISW